jgi:myo-inositol-1(or 4)-monophosphatase
MNILSPHLKIMTDAARNAAKGLIRDFGEVEKLQVSKKGPGDFVSNADRRAEEVIISTLLKARPDYGVLAEESAEQIKPNSEYKFVIDPLDGTNNFLHGFPYWSISIGLEKAGEIIAGVVMCPTLDEIYHAEKGQGAFLNNRRIRVSNRPSFSDAFVACGSPSSVRRKTKAPYDIIDVVTKISHEVSSVRCAGSAALDLCKVASGCFDGLVELSLKKWDIAAGIVIVKEAGGRITGVDGSENYYETGDIVASNSHLHEPILKLLSGLK